MNDFEGTERYRLIRKVGVGGMGSVYEVEDKKRGLRLALKTLGKNNSSESLLRFKREFRLVAGLRHPNLVRLYDLKVEQGVWFFTMALIKGQHLSKHMAKVGVAPPESPSNPLSADFIHTDPTSDPSGRPWYRDETTPLSTTHPLAEAVLQTPRPVPHGSLTPPQTAVYCPEVFEGSETACVTSHTVTAVPVCRRLTHPVSLRTASHTVTADR